MPTAHIGVVTGLPDLLNFIAALRKKAGLAPVAEANATALLFGGAGSLPQALITEFGVTIRRAFPALKAPRIPTDCVQAGRFNPDALPDLDLRRQAGERRIVYGNAIHKRFHQELYAYLQPDEFVFFDNGLSSYAEHSADIESDFAARGLPFPSLACYSLSPPLNVPRYLAGIPGCSLGMEDYEDAFVALRRLDSGWGAPGRPLHVIMGTSLFRTQKISWDEERATYLHLISQLKSTRPGETILYKAHPRACARPLITKGDGVDVVESTLPAEPFVTPGCNGAVYSITSTALFSFARLFSWKAHRIETPATRRLLDASPHLRMIDLISPTAIADL